MRLQTRTTHHPEITVREDILKMQLGEVSKNTIDTGSYIRNGISALLTVAAGLGILWKPVQAIWITIQDYAKKESTKPMAPNVEWHFFWIGLSYLLVGVALGLLLVDALRRARKSPYRTVEGAYTKIKEMAHKEKSVPLDPTHSTRV